MHHRARNLEEKGAATSATSAVLDSVSLTPSSFVSPSFHLRGNHSCLGRNGRYSSHFDLARGSSYYSLVALTDDSWM